MVNNITEHNARKIYEESKRELQAIVDNLTVSQSVANEAQYQLQNLGMEFASVAWNRFDARTTNLTEISKKLKKVIEASGQKTAAGALDQVTGVTAKLAKLVKHIDTLTGRRLGAG